MSETKTGAVRRVGLATLIGPGLMVAATGVGAGDLTGGTVAGSRYGLVLIWAVVLGAFFKFVLTEGLARWQLATDKTLVEGWAEYLPGWVKAYFGVYLFLWTVAVSAAMANASRPPPKNRIASRRLRHGDGIVRPTISLYGTATIPPMNA